VKARADNLDLQNQSPKQANPVCLACNGLLLSRGREDFFDFESSVLRLKYTHVADCKPQGIWTLPAKKTRAGQESYALESGLRATFRNSNTV
jgi:hypothetical protein